MSDELLKKSLKQDLAYIKAYQPELLQHIERVFKGALKAPTSTPSDKPSGAGLVAPPSTPEPPSQKKSPKPEPATLIPQKPERPNTVTDPASRVVLSPLPALHLWLPVLVVLTITALLILRH
jgi:hypothetical protein